MPTSSLSARGALSKMLHLSLHSKSRRLTGCRSIPRKRGNLGGCHAEVDAPNSIIVSVSLRAPGKSEKGALAQYNSSDPHDKGKGARSVNGAPIGGIEERIRSRAVLVARSRSSCSTASCDSRGNER